MAIRKHSQQTTGLLPEAVSVLLLQTSIEAAVGGDLKGFISDVSSSSVLMGTITDTFERAPDKTVDPTGMFASMGEEDKAKLNEVCAEMLADDSISQEQKENIKTLCSFMGGTVA